MTQTILEKIDEQQEFLLDYFAGGPLNVAIAAMALSMRALLMDANQGPEISTLRIEAARIVLNPDPDDEDFPETLN